MSWWSNAVRNEGDNNTDCGGGLFKGDIESEHFQVCLKSHQDRQGKTLILF